MSHNLSDFSVGFCRNEEKVICYQLEFGKELADILTECSSRHQGESEEVRTNIAFIAMHYWGYTSLEIKGRWGLLLPASSSQWSSNQGLPVFHLSWSASLRVLSGCAGPPSPTAPVLHHGPALCFPPSWLDGDSPMHGLLQLTSSPSPSHRNSRCSFSLVASLHLVSPM